MPRSPSRDLSDRYTGKRGYFRTPDAIRFWKYVLAGLAFAAASGWAAVDLFQPTRAAYGHTHGPLANPHAAFDDNCAACHAPQSWSGSTPTSLLDARKRWHDLTCEKCHAGPGHHDSATADAKEYHSVCSNCHHDHNGRSHSLVRISDSHCARCHDDLGKWHDASKSKVGDKPYQNKISNFAAENGHPEFRSLNVAPESRTLKFSHAVHMDAGLGIDMKIADIRTLSASNPAAAEAYAALGTGPNGVIKLECASCHKLDSGAGTPGTTKLKEALNALGESGHSKLPPRAEGAYFLPVDFEVHCRSCHPLQAPTGTTAVGENKYVIPGFEVAHRKQPSAVLADLKAGYLKGLITPGNPPLVPPPGPGGKADTRSQGSPALAAEINRLATAAEEKLYAPALPGPAKVGTTAPGCLKCHETSGAGAARRIEPVPNRTIWLEHAKFNHASHRGATCATCHPGTDLKLNRDAELVQKEPVQILGLKTCQACHSPTDTTVKLADGSETAGGGVRHKCTDCHRYHHGDQTMQGRGAASWTPKEPRNLADWLKGK